MERIEIEQDIGGQLCCDGKNPAAGSTLSDKACREEVPTDGCGYVLRTTRLEFALLGWASRSLRARQRRRISSACDRTFATDWTRAFLTSLRRERSNPVPRCDHDIFVLGRGSGGIRAARVAASKDAKVAIAKKHLLGRTCVVLGCDPKKLLTCAAALGQDIEPVERFGQSVKAATIEWLVPR